MATEPARPTGSAGWGCLASGAALALALSLGALILLWALQVWLPRAGLPFGFVAEACVWWGTTAGIYWMPYGSGLEPPPGLWPHAACGYVPWGPTLPLYGSLVFPQ